VIGIAEPTPAVSQNGRDLVGTWTLVSAITDRDGNKSDIYGANANGVLVFDANGRYAIVFIAANLPKFASNNRATGTADENKVVIVGSLAHFGTYVVDEADKSFTFQTAPHSRIGRARTSSVLLSSPATSCSLQILKHQPVDSPRSPSGARSNYARSNTLSVVPGERGDP